jgi:hypothetical protein
VIPLDPQAIRYWGCVVFPGMSRGRFQGLRQRRFCNAVVEERYLFRGLALADDPHVRILRRRFEQGLSLSEAAASTVQPAAGPTAAAGRGSLAQVARTPAAALSGR